MYAENGKTGECSAPGTAHPENSLKPGKSIRSAHLSGAQPFFPCGGTP